MAAADLEFVRSPRVDDDVDPRWSMWRDPEGGPQDVVWLAPQDVQINGLTDKLRVGYAAERSEIYTVEALDEIATATDEDVRRLRPRADHQLLGGHTDSWRWQRVEDGDEVFLAIDNKPAVLARAEDPTKPPIPYQHVVIPEEILEVIQPRSTA